MRAFVFGNGASIACGQHTGGDFLTWGLAEAKLALSGDAHTQNVRLRIRSGLETLIQRLDELRGAYTGSPGGLYWPTNLQEFIPYIYNQLKGADEKTAEDNLTELLKTTNFSPLVEEVVRKASDASSYTYLSVVQKRHLLLGPHSGNFLDTLEDLQRDIAGLACHGVRRPNHYDDFVKLLAGEPDDIVINLNWDTLFEDAYRRVIRSEPNHAYLMGGLTVRGAVAAGRHVLSKPHGSIEYLCCQSDAHSNASGCFRLSVLPGTWNFPMGSAGDRKCAHGCPYGQNLRPFLHPYARVIRSRRAAPFVAAALESLKPMLFDIKEVISIGYSFSDDGMGWVDEDLLPIFLGKRLHIIDRDLAGATRRVAAVKAGIGLTDVLPVDAAGFDGYVRDSLKAGRLLPK